MAKNYFQVGDRVIRTGPLVGRPGIEKRLGQKAEIIRVYPGGWKSGRPFHFKIRYEDGTYGDITAPNIKPVDT